MAVHISGMGYSKEVGYNQFLYPNEAETRGILLFLVSNLPARGGKGAEAKDGEGEEEEEDKVARAVAREVKKAYKGRSAASRACASVPLVTLPLSLARGSKDARVVGWYERGLRIVTSQHATISATVPSIMSENRRGVAVAAAVERRYGAATAANPSELAAAKRARLGLLSRSLGEAVRANVSSERASDRSLDAAFSLSTNFKGSAFSHAVDFSQEKSGQGVGPADPAADAAALAAKQEAEVAELRNGLAALTGRLDEAERATEAAIAGTRLIDATIRTLEAEKEALEAAYQTKKRTHELLADVEGNAAELKKLSAESAQLQIELATEWEKRRVPIVEAIRDFKETIEKRKRECASKLERIKTMRSEMKEMIAEVREKDETVTQKTAEYERMNKDADRALYTKRILDIVKNVKRQNDEIGKILLDSRQLRQQINSASETLNRSFGTADELIFKRATSDPGAKQAYKLLVELHECFATLVRLTEETGAAANTSKDLQTKIDAMSVRNDGLNEERVAEDLKQIRKENKALLEKLGK
jgi:hypothetical protein